MNSFTRKSLAVALAGASILGIADPADAVRVSSNGTGQVLLYPYYTVRGNSAGKEFNTLMSVVNATSAVKAVKVRFREGRNSREVMDFNLFLSPNDVWVAAIVPTADGAKLITGDQSCADPGVIAAQGGRADNAVDFVNYAYASDPAGGAIDRVREGWFEIIEMGPVANLTVANAATHNSAGMPANCALVRQVDAGIGLGGTNVGTPNGGLFGSETLLNVQLGTDYTADPVALDNWRNATAWTAPGSIAPDLRGALPQMSTVITTIGGEEQVIVTGRATSGGTNNADPISSVLTYDPTWGGTNNADPVSAVLMHETILNEYVLDTVTQSGTDWIVTFPTKSYYYPGSVINNQIAVTNLFQRNFTSIGAIDDMSSIWFDREERYINIVEFSGPLCLPAAVPWGTTVFSFNHSNVLASANTLGGLFAVCAWTTSFQNGWMKVDFYVGAGTGTVVPNNHQLRSSAVTTVFTPGTGATVTYPSATYFGLPVIGFAVSSYTNGFVPSGCTPGTCVLSNYGGNWVHKYTENIKTP